MRLIQSYFNSHITRENIDYAGGFLSAVVHWLSMAYSCLLLKKNNPGCQLTFYGSDATVHVFKDLFKFPYDEYNLVDCTGEYANWFYCWPKIVTYMKQEEPFIHVDNDVFMWRPMPSRLLYASLVAQHKERDSRFYMEVYNQIKKDQVLLSEYLVDCNDGQYVNSFNAGLLGGNDMDFIKRYLEEILKFLDSNKKRLRSSGMKFLYNVVFEQWLFYGLTRKENKKVRTYYEATITDFDMVKASVPRQVLTPGGLDYLHVMEYKDNIRCNRFIAYQMLREFPREYERVLSVCKTSGVRSGFYSRYTYENIEESGVFTHGERLYKEQGCLDDSCKELKKLEEIEASFLLRFQDCRDIAIKGQMNAWNHLCDLTSKGERKIKARKFTLSPYVKFVEAGLPLVKALVSGAHKELPDDAAIVLVYNAVFNHVDEFIWTKERLRFLLSLMENDTVDVDLLLNPSGNEKINKVSLFCKQCLFDGIITFI